MGRMKDRVGEKGINNFGSQMIILRYRGTYDMDVYFPEYDSVVSEVTYDRFLKGNVKCLYEPRVCGIGFLGEGKYDVQIHNEIYGTWKKMIQRGYSDVVKKCQRTYQDVSVCDEWHNFQNFAEWYENNYYQVGNEKMHLDKDILHKGNNIYSPSTCIFVPERINALFTKANKMRGDCPIGVSKHQGKYQASCNFGEGSRYIGLYESKENAFEMYKYTKENYIKQIADEYKSLIPNKLYNALYKYEVEITD